MGREGMGLDPVAVAAATAPRLAAPARLLVGGVSAAGAAALAVRGTQALEGSPRLLGAALLILVATVAADRLTLALPHGGEDEEFTLSDAVWVAAIVLAPPGAPTLGGALGMLCCQVIRRRPPAKAAFNVGQYALALTAAELIWGLARSAPQADEVATWGLATAASGGALVVNAGLVAVVIALVGRESFRAVLLGSARVTVLQWLGNLSIGLLAALAWHVNPAGVVLVAVPLGLAYLAYREWVAGLVEREQMEDMARTAERIARDGDPSARLPMQGREGRLAQLTASLNRMLEQLDRAFARDRHLMKEAAAELHDPVRAIRRELGAAGPRRETLADLLGRVDQVLGGMEAVASAGHPGAVRPAPVLLAPFLERVGHRGRELLDDRLTVSGVPVGAVACLDASWVERALLHLLDNAAIHGRFTSPVTLSAAPCTGGWRFEVADEGGGVPAGQEDAVFEPFYRASSIPGRPGLGLALVRSVAEAHGGSTGILNRPGVGATFWLRVPA
jgi:signal transduction histidine kinase